MIDLGDGGGWGESGRVCTKWVCLHVISEKMKIYSYHHVVKNLYTQDVSYGPDKIVSLYSRIYLTFILQSFNLVFGFTVWSFPLKCCACLTISVYIL